MSTTVETTKELTEQTEQVAQKQNKKQTKFHFDFSTTEDLFISTKGRELRNK